MWHLNPSNSSSRVHECDRRQTEQATEKERFRLITSKSAKRIFSVQSVVKKFEIRLIWHFRMPVSNRANGRRGRVSTHSRQINLIDTTPYSFVPPAQWRPLGTRPRTRRRVERKGEFPGEWVSEWGLLCIAPVRSIRCALTNKVISMPS